MIVKVNFQCPVCENVISAPEGMRGQLWKCPHCKYSVKIPEQSPNPPNCEHDITIPEQSPKLPNYEYNITIPEQSPNSSNCQYSIKTPKQRSNSLNDQSNDLSKKEKVDGINMPLVIIAVFAGSIILGLLLNYYKDEISMKNIFAVMVIILSIVIVIKNSKRNDKK